MIKIKRNDMGKTLCCDEDKEYEIICIDIPTDANTAMSFDMGDTVDVTLKGKIKRINASKSEYSYGSPGTIELQLESLKVDGKNAFSEMVEGEVR